MSSGYIILAGGHIRVYIVGFTMTKSLSCQPLAIDKICVCLIYDDGSEVVWCSNESQVFAGQRIPSEVPFDNAGIFNLGSFVLTVIDGDKIAIGYFTEKAEWDFSIKTGVKKQAVSLQ